MLGDLTNVQYKPIWNCYNESPLYNQYILIKKKKPQKTKGLFTMRGFEEYVDFPSSEIPGAFSKL
jgi:hypothetical protein